MRVLKVESGARRQLSDEGILLFWRPGREPGALEGLLCVAFSCGNSECDCRGMILDLQCVDERAVRVSVEGGTIEVISSAQPDGVEPFTDHSFGAASVQLDIDSGRMEPKSSRADERLVTWLEREVDGEVLDALHRAWLRSKGMEEIEDEPDLTLEGWQPSQLLAYEDIFPGSRMDAYWLDGKLYMAVDLYCTTLRCTCERATLVFIELNPGTLMIEREVGDLVLSFRGGEPLDRTFEPGCDGLLERLWELVQRRYSVGNRLRQRSTRLDPVRVLLLDRIIRMLPPLEPPFRAPEEPGRNEPCPCGSGLKYKRCCLLKQQDLVN